MTQSYSDANEIFDRLDSWLIKADHILPPTHSPQTGESMTDKIHVRDSTRNVHGDYYPTACGVRVIREHLAIKGPGTCPDCKRKIKNEDTNP